MPNLTKRKFKNRDLVYCKGYDTIFVVLGYDEYGYVELETLEGFDYSCIATDDKWYLRITHKYAKRLIASEEEYAKEEYKRALKTLAKTRKRVAKYLSSLEHESTNRKANQRAS